MKRLFWALPLLGLAACGNDDSTTTSKDVLMRSDIDGVAGWLSDPTALTKGEAHSGLYALRIAPDREFSPGYTAVVGQLSPTRLRGIRMEAWAYAPDQNAKAKLEFIVRDPAGQDLLHDFISFDQVQDYGKWVKISKDIILPPTVNYTSRVIIYLARAEATRPAYVDDLQLSALR